MDEKVRNERLGRGSCEFNPVRKNISPDEKRDKKDPHKNPNKTEGCNLRSRPDSENVLDLHNSHDRLKILPSSKMSISAQVAVFWFINYIVRDFYIPLFILYMVLFCYYLEMSSKTSAFMFIHM